MNSRYFICKTHKKYTDAGYRWAYWLLEAKGVVTLNGAVDVAVVFSEHSYWHPAESEACDWLSCGILPTVKQFLETHKLDEIAFVDEDFLVEQSEHGFQWREVDPPAIVSEQGAFTHQCCGTAPSSPSGASAQTFPSEKSPNVVH
jgi:hypothetical protein